MVRSKMVVDAENPSRCVNKLGHTKHSYKILRWHMQLISMVMHLKVVNVKVAHHNNVFVCERITVQATLFKSIKKSTCLGGR